MPTDDGKPRDERARGFAGLNSMASDLGDREEAAENQAVKQAQVSGATPVTSGRGPSRPHLTRRWLQAIVLLVAFAIANNLIWLVLSSRRGAEREVKGAPEKTAAFLQSLAEVPKVEFKVVNVRVSEEIAPAKIGTCRGFNTVITIATESEVFRHRPGSLQLLVRDEASPDSEGNGRWVITNCEMLPVELDATFGWSIWMPDADPPLSELRGGRFTAACIFSKSKGCFESSVGGDYSAGRAVERQKPQYKMKLLSWGVVRGIEGSIVQ